MDNDERLHIPAMHAQPHFGLDEADHGTLRQLDDTSYLAVGVLDEVRCQRLVRHGLATCDSQGYWKITPSGRRLIR